LVTFAVVPLILLAMLLHLCGPVVVEMAVWWLADRLLAALFWFLRLLPHGWLSWIFAGGISALPWLLLLVWRFHAWRSLPALCLAARCC
jgi:competence protein ComEC